MEGRNQSLTTTITIIIIIQEMIRSTWEWHNDYEALCNSLRAMKQIADHINESLHKSEKANKVVKIQSDLGM